MIMIIQSEKIGFAVAVAISALAVPAHAVTFGVFGSATTQASASAIAGGHTSSVLADLTAASLTGLDVLWVLNGNNSAQSAALVGNADVSSFVSGGGVLMYHDLNVSDASTALPGGDSIVFTRMFSANIDVESLVDPLVTGPGGTITNATLDGGSWSNHGFASLGSLPAGAVAYLNNGTPGNIVDFSYGFGAGWVYYSSIPAEFYLRGSGSNGNSFRNIYVPNAIAQAASLGSSAVVPEPASWAMLIAGFGLVGAVQRRRHRATVAA